MLRTVLPLVRSAHKTPVRTPTSRPPLACAIPWHPESGPSARSRSSASSAGSKTPRGQLTGGRSVTSDFTVNGSRGSRRAAEHSRLVQDQARTRLQNSPVQEGQDCDAVSFCTSEGWSPAVLALLLHVVDPARQVQTELLETMADPTAPLNPRHDIFLELLKTGKSLLEDSPGASPPVIPQRFHNVSEQLVCRAVDEFGRLCKAGGAERTAYRALHATLCAACQFNRLEVARHLLERSHCDPRCKFVTPVECRPLHVATSSGFGYLAQLLLEHRADPLESDESKQLPVYKLTRYYAKQVSHLQSRIGDLEAQLREARVGTADQSWSFSPSIRSSPRSPSRPTPRLTPRLSVSAGGTPRPPSAMSPRVLHDSRM